MIPDFQTLMRPVLAHIATTDELRSRAVKDAMADEFQLTLDERAAVLPSGRQRTIDNRVGWALTYLAQSGLVERPRRGVVRISDAGREALRRHPDRIDMRTLEAYPAYIAFRDRTRTDERGDAADRTVVPTPTATPQDLLEQALKENQAVVASELLARALALPPVGFEDLVLRLLAAMGYGDAGRVERTSATGDAGVDGIISQDPLGLDRIYVQAKRYDSQRVVHRPTIQSFVGALMGAQGDRGVFLTTGTFSSGAREEADRVAFRIELIDGQRLARLMLQYGVGVQPQSSVTLFEVDEDYFEGL